ncbi:Coiled-coil domain-containing protein 39 [Fasciola hepatica]|uniref:Coiled-coil domain-containing protein 39 n=1 Tax=Fasciola hepatica TaxID=6192 RepID=A0A4E0RRC2_FASHE|nr:Coiled-coil domain-containing protein 39 [Fasciola hepatica]
MIVPDSCSVVTNVLAELGWDQAYAIPMASEENRALLHKLDELHGRLHEQGNIYATECDKVKQLRDHMHTVKQEIDNTAALCELREQNIQDGEHLHKTVQREHGKMKMEMEKIVRLNDGVRERKSRLENLKFIKKSELEKAMQKTKQDKAGLEEWMRKIEERDEDTMIMKKYIRQDDSRIKELDLEIQNLTDKLREKKTKLDNIFTKTQTNQVALDRACEEARTAYTERDSLIAQWEHVINRMRERDEELRNFAQRLNEMRLMVDEQEITLREREDFLRTQKEITNEAERRLVETVNGIAKHKLELTESEMRRQNFLSELEALKRTVDKMASDLESMRTKISQLKKEKVQKAHKLETLRQQLEDLKERLTYVSQSKLTVEQLANEADAELSADEANYQSLAGQLQHLRDVRFKVTQNFEDMKSKSKLLEQQVEGARASLRMLNSKLVKLDTQLLRQQEMIYKEDFRLQQLEQRVSRMCGEHNEEEKTALEKQVRHLNAELEDRTKTVTALTNELVSLKSEVYRVKREAHTLQERSGQVEDRLKTSELEVEIATREKVKMETILQQLLVEQNMMRLQVRRLHGTYQKHANKVFDLETAKQELELTVQERRQEITLHQQMLLSEHRIAFEENSQLRIEFQARRSKIDKLIKRYEILTSLMAPPEGEEVHTQTYYLIRAAQEKEELQRKGDLLDAETRQAEQELIALENTLAVMNGCNQVFQMSYSKLPEDSEEIKLEKELREEHRVLSIKLRYDMDRMSELRQLIKNLTNELIAVQHDMDPYLQQIEELTQELERKNKDIVAQRERLSRAQIRLKKAVAKSEAKQSDQLNLIRSDIQIRMLKEHVEQLTRDALNCLKSDDLIVEQAQTLLTASGLSYPRTSAQRSRRGSQFSSIHSHVSSPSIALSPASSGSVTPLEISRAPSARSMDARSKTIQDSIISGEDFAVRSELSISLHTPTTIDLSLQATLPGDASTRAKSQSSKKSQQSKPSSGRSSTGT